MDRRHLIPLPLAMLLVLPTCPPEEPPEGGMASAAAPPEPEPQPQPEVRRAVYEARHIRDFARRNI